MSLAIGSLLLLFTDGLIEHRTRPADVGMEQLAGLVATHRDLPLPDLVDRLVRMLHSHTEADDRCMAAVRVTR